MSEWTFSPLYIMLSSIKIMFQESFSPKVLGISYFLILLKESFLPCVKYFYSLPHTFYSKLKVV